MIHTILINNKDKKEKVTKKTLIEFINSKNYSSDLKNHLLKTVDNLPAHTYAFFYKNIQTYIMRFNNES